MLGIILSLSSSALWGTGDFLGGREARRTPALTVTLWSHVAGGLAITSIAFATRTDPPFGAMWRGALAGVAGGIALSLFYKALADGLMSLVAPVSATAAVIPVAWGLSRGETLSGIEWSGVVMAILGVIVISLSPGTPEKRGTPARGTIALAIGAAGGFGFFLVLVAAGTEVAEASAASPLWVVSGSRVGSVTTVALVLALARRVDPRPGRRLPMIVVVGAFDVTANAFYAIATTRGATSVIAVLASLFPVVTALLARAFDKERVSALQGVGAVAALGGAVLISAG